TSSRSRLAPRVLAIAVGGSVGRGQYRTDRVQVCTPAVGGKSRLLVIPFRLHERDTFALVVECVRELRSDGVVKVLDFGLAKGSGNSDTERGLIMGTTAYMSPEQARGEAVDARTDVWSLAVVIYEMINGRVPFTGETHRQVVNQILHNEPPTFESAVPGELKQIVLKALNKDRTQRYDTASTMANDLKSLQEELEVRARLELSNANEAVARSTLPHLPTHTAGHTRRNIFQRHKVFTGIAIIFLIGAVSWAYVAAHRDSNAGGTTNREAYR